MVIRKGTTFALLGATLLLVSCVPPKAEVVETPAPVEKKVEKKPEPALVEEAPLPPVDDSGLRMPDMLSMPGDGDFRATNPSARPGIEASGVTSRPPTDPPSRVKPKEEEPKSE